MEEDYISAYMMKRRRKMMFEFFEKIETGIGFKLVSDFSEKLTNFISKTIKNSNGKENDHGKNGANIGSNGRRANIGSNGHEVNIGSNGHEVNIGSNGYGANIGSNGHEVNIGSNGYGANIGSNGDRANIGSNGHRANIGSNGRRANIGSNGDRANIGSNGHGANIGSNGYGANIGSNGHGVSIGSNGDEANISSNGEWAKIGSNGHGANIASNGYGTKIEVKGENTIAFATGRNSIIKAKKGTWISLVEYGKDKNGKYIPIFAKSAQIGNKEYKDHKGKILKSTVFYTLWKKEFYEVDEFDGIRTIKISEKKRDGITIIKAVDMSTLLNDEIKEIYIAKEDKLSAHGYTLREAVEDLTFKKMKNVNIDEIVAKIKETEKVTRSQYRAITGACSFGTNRFCEQHNIQDLEEIELSELRKILIDDYGARKFWDLIDKEGIRLWALEKN